MDDKGPAVIILHALKKIKDLGLKPKRTIKFILGCNEESGWKCIEHYKKVSALPEEGFSPDADFPAIYAEKGILHIKFKFELNNYSFKNLNGGSAMNMVCDYCEVENLIIESMASHLNLEIIDNKVISRGKSAHASTPELGENALAKMLKYLKLNHIYTLLFEEKFGLSELKDQTGNLTFSPNIIKQKNNELYVTCDIRYPATMNLTQILEIINKYGIQYKILNHQSPLFNDENSDLIQQLNNAYNTIKHKSIRPIAIGGGTYARALKYGVAFGPQELDEMSTIHQPDEYISFKTIEDCFKIYFLAIKNICFE